MIIVKATKPGVGDVLILGLTAEHLRVLTTGRLLQLETPAAVTIVLVHAPNDESLMALFREHGLALQ